MLSTWQHTGMHLTFGEYMPIPVPVLPFEIWLSVHAEELSIKVYEQAEPVFDFEHFVLSQYDIYCTKCSLNGEA